MRTLNFKKLNVSNDIINALNGSNKKEATPFQESVLSNILDDKNIFIKGENDSEKSTAIAVAALEKLNRADSREEIRVLILAATPNAAREIHTQITEISSSKEVSVCVDDEGERDQQAQAIAGQTPIVVANPNRLQDLLQEHRFIFRHLDLLVLDEMHLLVKNDTKNILKQIKRRILNDYTTLVCSEKYDDSLKNVSESFAGELSVVGFSDSTASTPPAIRGTLQQNYIKVPNRMKISTLMAHIEQTPTENCIVFTASKRGTDRLYRVLKKRGLKATSLHRKLSDEKRAQRFSNFTNSDVQYLLVSDISAADLNSGDVLQVINYDVPNSSDEYRFRAALVGDYKKARIVSLVSKQDQNDISQLQNELGQTPEEIPLPDKVKQKLKERKNNKKSSNGRNKKSRGNRPNNSTKKSNEMQLPQPNYDKLSGGRSGNHDEKTTGVVKFFKKLFS